MKHDNATHKDRQVGQIGLTANHTSRSFKVIFLPTNILCFLLPTHIAQIGKPHKLHNILKLAKKCNFLNAAQSRILVNLKKIITMKTKSIITILSVFSLITLIFYSCGSRDERLGKVRNNQQTEELVVDAVKNTPGYGKSFSGKTQNTNINQQHTISKVIFFIENSGSMLGYVRQANDYKNAIVCLSYFPEFDNSIKEFYFINGTSSLSKGSNISLNLIGSDPELLKNNLNRSSFNENGDTRYSDLTRMFEKVLSCAKGGEISILVSDCIYDVGEESDPLTALRIETEKTKKVFRDRLATENIQTIIIKAESKFDGQYYYASKKGSQYLNQKRPYYILIFGDSKLLNKHFTEDNISNKVAGYVSMARFMKIDNIKIPYQATNQNSKGTFRFHKANKNKLMDAEKDRNGQGFQFSIAVDYSSLPFPDAYYKSHNNYSQSGTYKIVEIYKPSKKIPEVTSFNTSHLITVCTKTSPYGNIELTLKYEMPTWINETGIVDEKGILGDTIHTFGFKYLIDAITEAYQYKNKQQNLSSFKFEILK